MEAARRQPLRGLWGAVLLPVGDPARRSGCDRGRSVARVIVQCDESGTGREQEGATAKGALFALFGVWGLCRI